MSKRFTYWNSISSRKYYLDLFPGAFQCIAVRLESSTYTGSLFEIRRDSDNAFDGFLPDFQGLFSLFSRNSSGEYLSAWVGSNNGFIYKGKDQTGNGNDFVQATLGNQPKIINAGVLLVDNNGLAAPTYDGANSRFDVSTSFNGHAVLNNDYVLTTSDTHVILFKGDSGNYSFASQSGSSSTQIARRYGAIDVYVDGTIVSPRNRGAIYTAVNGVSKVVTEEKANTTELGWSNLNITFGYYRFGGFSFNGICQFVASFASDQSASRTARTTYLNTYYPPS